MLILIVRSMRPQQWLKNMFIFAGLIFSGNLFNIALAAKSISAFAFFCLLSGSIYLINDVIDLESDRKHPAKSRRPLAAGAIKTSHALVVAIILIVLSLFASFRLNLSFGLITLLYFVTFLLYSITLKHVVIIDVLVLSFAYVLRVLAGVVVIAVEISSWLILCTILLALFLGISKRRHELVLLGERAGQHRRILNKYTPQLLDQMIAVVTSSTIMAYSLYTFTSQTAIGSQYLMFTIPFVLFGIFRYLYLVYKEESGGNPTTLLLTDRPLLINVLLWAAVVIFIIYQ